MLDLFINSYQIGLSRDAQYRLSQIGSKTAFHLSRHDIAIVFSYCNLFFPNDNRSDNECSSPVFFQYTTFKAICVKHVAGLHV